MQNFKHWDSFLYFCSASNSQEFLKNSYRRLNIESADQKSYENCYPFIYYLEHAQIYYEQAKLAPIVIQPILLFYGFVHLIKACILTVDPNYPETTSVLAHGVSARKRKKQQYHFFQDEVRFQKSGLFPYMGMKMFHMKHLEGQKATMKELLAQLPELNSLFIETAGKSNFLKLNKQGEQFSLPKKILDHYFMTETHFLDYLKREMSSSISLQEPDEDFIHFNLDEQQQNKLLPIKYCMDSSQYYFPLAKNDLNQFPELLIHYLLLYNLSMIARYETEWWSELIKMMPNEDYPFIRSFLNLTAKKGPYLIYQILKEKK